MVNNEVMNEIEYTFRLETFDNSDTIKYQIQCELEALLDKFSCNQIKMPLYTCTNELLINAIKANYKNLYFEQYEPRNNALEIIPYHKALQLFKLEMSTNRIDYLLKLAEDKGVSAVIEFIVYKPNILEIKVTNPASMTEVEHKNVKKKIEQASRYTSLTEYFCFTDDDPNKEGGGLGLIFIVMMLKSFGCTAGDFFIHSKERQTIAGIKIPLSEETINNYHNNTRD